MTANNYSRELPENFGRFATDTAKALGTNANRVLAVIFYACVHQIAPNGNTNDLIKLVSATNGTKDIALFNSYLGVIFKDKAVKINKEGRIILKKTRVLNEDACETIFEAMNKGTGFRHKVLTDALGITGGESKAQTWDDVKSVKKMVALATMMPEGQEITVEEMLRRLELFKAALVAAGQTANNKDTGRFSNQTNALN